MVWNDNFASHQHQVVDTDSRPLVATLCFLSAIPTDAQFGADLPTSVEEEPDVVALFRLAGAAGDVGAVVEDEGNDDLGGFDGFLHEEEFFAEVFSGLGFVEEGGFGHCFGGDGEVGVGSDTLSLDGGAILWCRCW